MGLTCLEFCSQCWHNDNRALLVLTQTQNKFKLTQWDVWTQVNQAGLSAGAKHVSSKGTKEPCVLIVKSVEHFLQGSSVPFFILNTIFFFWWATLDNLFYVQLVQKGKWWILNPLKIKKRVSFEKSFTPANIMICPCSFLGNHRDVTCYFLLPDSFRFSDFLYSPEIFHLPSKNQLWLLLAKED